MEIAFRSRPHPFETVCGDAIAGIGNITFTTVSREPVHAISHPGVVGHRVRKVVESSFLISPGDLLCLASDGLKTALSLHGVSRERLDDSAHRLLELYGRDNDDATVVLIAV